MTSNIHRLKGFTLIELVITIAIIGILAAIAIPSYINYDNKVKFSEIVLAVDSLKNSIAQCAHIQGTITGCSNAANGIPSAQTAAGCVTSVTVANGVITGTAAISAGCLTTADTYILTPVLQTNGVVTWTKGGTCVTDAWC